MPFNRSTHHTFKSKCLLVSCLPNTSANPGANKSETTKWPSKDQFAIQTFMSPSTNASAVLGVNIFPTETKALLREFPQYYHTFVSSLIALKFSPIEWFISVGSSEHPHHLLKPSRRSNLYRDWPDLPFGFQRQLVSNSESPRGTLQVPHHHTMGKGSYPFAKGLGIGPKDNSSFSKPSHLEWQLLKFFCGEKTLITWTLLLGLHMVNERILEELIWKTSNKQAQIYIYTNDIR